MISQPVSGLEDGEPYLVVVRRLEPDGPVEVVRQFAFYQAPAQTDADPALLPRVLEGCMTAPI